MEDTKKNVGLDLTSGSIFKQLMIFVLPLLLANIVQQLYDAVDMIVIGKFVGKIGSAGVSTGSEVATLITFVATSFGSAGQIYVAQLFGAKNRKAISEMIGTSLVFMIALALLFTFMCFTCADIFLGWLNCPEDSYAQARSYMVVVSLGFPFIFGYNMVCGILRGMGEAKRPLIFIIVAAIANIFMDLLMVVVFKMEAAGTAIATAAAQMASFIAAFIFLYRKREQLGLDFSAKGLHINTQHLGVILKLGLPLCAQSVFIHFTQLICSSRINLYGSTATATNGIGNRIQKLVNIFANSITAGSGAMVGQNIGARKHDRVKKIVFTTMGCAACLAFMSILAAIFIPRQLFGLFSNDPDVLDLGVNYMRIDIIIFVLSTIQGSFQEVVTGSGFTQLSFFIGVMDGVILRLGISFLLAYTFDMGIIGFFYGNALARLGPATIAGAYFFSGKWKTRKLLAEKK